VERGRTLRRTVHGDHYNHGGRYREQRYGFVHHLDRTTTSFYFTNFPVDVKVMDLWGLFSKFGRVGEVYIPKKLDKNGNKFGFVKFKEVKDALELEGRMGDVW
jgi:RNA recognition motif-containing protein